MTQEEKRNRFREEFRYANEFVLDPGRFTPETFGPYNSLVTLVTLEVVFYAFEPEGDEVQKQLSELEKLRHQLVTRENGEKAWDIWGEQIPVYGEVGDFDMTYTNPDFRPLLVPYLAGDQTAVKGNIIVIAGGGYAMRCNAYEGFNVAEYYRSNGYNAYVLQRRISPYYPANAHLDLQRAVRVIRSRAEKGEIGHGDRIAAIGFSGGGATIYGAVMDHYGHMLPDRYDPSYKPDETDHVDSDLQAALYIYGTGKSIQTTENPHIPPCFMVTGDLDEYHADTDSLLRYSEMKEKGLDAEVHIFSRQHHGFGLGDGNCDSMRSAPEAIPGVELWPKLSLAFLERTFN